MKYLDRYRDLDVLVTGACGTIGSELVAQLLASGARRIVAVDNNETELFFLRERTLGTGRVECHLCDIRDLESIKRRMREIDVVLHAAALKHVGLCEDSPDQAIRTNILGTQNIIEAAVAEQVDRVVFTSSDKAVNPTNVMGTTKLMGERLMTAASQSHPGSRTIFASTRFGNVLGSRGSVVPLFRRQIEEGHEITLTDPEMTRFIMTRAEAVSLVLDSVWLAEGGEVFVTKMPVARIEDLALAMRAALAPDRDVPIRVIGPKPGEKMYEELMNEEEVRRTYDLGAFFMVLSAFQRPGTHPLAEGRDRPDRPYNSAYEPAMTYEDLDAYLRDRRILDEDQ